MQPLIATLSPPVDPERDHVRGSAEAAVTLVEYGDFQCPYCGEAYPVVRELQERFGDQLRFVFRHMPLADLHPRAPFAAEAAEAAGAQERFWEMHDRLFEHRLRAERVGSARSTPRRWAFRTASASTASCATASTQRGSRRTTGAAPRAACRALRASS